MILIGQYDSPFVRRVAVSLHWHGLPFERRVLSVFNDLTAMLAINPLGKVPALQLDDGEVLFDSRAIVDYVDGLVPPERRLVPAQEPDRHRVLRIEAVAIGLTEKLYERAFEQNRRAPEKRDQAVIERTERQIASALAWLEALNPSPWLHGERLTIADVSTAIALTHLREKLPTLSSRVNAPALMAHRDRCEALDAFSRAAFSASEARQSQGIVGSS
ncbi:MAG: glutathione S-transferase family protein [Alphaproteobacteria bacterium]|nr:glutathione S-transferase family protein [Alphaproteobacteria bacterium]